MRNEKREIRVFGYDCKKFLRLKGIKGDCNYECLQTVYIGMNVNMVLREQKTSTNLSFMHRKF